MASVKDLRSKPLSSMSATELRGFISSGEAAGYSLSTSKELGKAQDLLKVMEPAKYSPNQVTAAGEKLKSNTTPETQVALGLRSASDLTGYLDTFQTTAFNADNALAMGSTRATQLKNELSGGLEAPTPLNRTQTFLDLRGEYKVDALETQSNSLDAQIEAENALYETQRSQERAKPVAMNVIEGRISQEETAATERISFLTRQKNSITNQLNTAYTVIGQIMQFQTLDYNDAVKSYEDQFNQNLQIYNILRTEYNDAKADFYKQQDAARSNLQIMQNAITSGNISYSDLPDTQKTLIQKLEIQSGLPQGFTVSLKLAPKDKVLFTSEYQGVTTVGVLGESGQVTTQTYGTARGNGSNPSQFDTVVDESKKAEKFMMDHMGGDNKVGSDVYLAARQNWVNNTGNTYKDFDDKFDNFAKGSQSSIEEYDLRNKTTGL